MQLKFPLFPKHGLSQEKEKTWIFWPCSCPRSTSNWKESEWLFNIRRGCSSAFLELLNTWENKENPNGVIVSCHTKRLSTRQNQCMWTLSWRDCCKCWLLTHKSIWSTFVCDESWLQWRKINETSSSGSQAIHTCLRIFRWGPCPLLLHATVWHLNEEPIYLPWKDQVMWPRLY